MKKQRKIREVTHNRESVAPREEEAGKVGQPRLPLRSVFVITFLISFLVYLRTLSPGLVFGDGPELATAAYVLGVPHPTGYPLYMLLLRLWMFLPIGEPIVAAHLFSAVCGAVAAGLAAVVVCDLLSQLFSAWPRKALLVLSVCVGLLCAFLRVEWENSVVTEVYALHMVFAMGFVRAVQLFERRRDRRSFYLAAVCFALGLAHHRLSSSFFVPIALLGYLGWKSWGRKQALSAFLLAGGIVVLGLLFYLYLPLRAAARPPINWGNCVTWDAFYRHVSGKEYISQRFLSLAPGAPFVLSWWLRHEYLVLQEFVGQIAAHAFPVRLHELMLLDNRMYFAPSLAAFLLGTSVFLLAVVGYRQWFRCAPLLAGATVLIGLHNFAVILLYNIADITDYIAFVLWCIYIGMILGVLKLAASAAAKMPSHWLRPRAEYAYAAVVFPLAVFLTNFSECDESRRDDAEQYSYFVLPLKKEQMPENSVLVTAADFDIFCSWYRQLVRKERTDVFVFGGNFISSPWYESFFTKEEINKYGLRFYNGPAKSPEEYAHRLREGIFDHVVGRYPVYTTLSDPVVLEILGHYYTVKLVARHMFLPRKILGLRTVPIWEIKPKGKDEKKQ